MRLNEIKPVITGFTDLTEGVIPPHISMTLAHVIRDGKVTNNVQYFTLAGLTEMFKSGGPTRWPRDLNDYSMSTSAELIEEIKSLPAGDHVALATWLLEQLQRPVNFETNPYANNPVLNVTEWLRYVIKKQA